MRFFLLNRSVDGVKQAVGTQGHDTRSSTLSFAAWQAFWWLNKRRSFGKEPSEDAQMLKKEYFAWNSFVLVLLNSPFHLLDSSLFPLNVYDFQTCYFSLFFDSSKSVTWKVHGRSRDKIAESPKCISCKNFPSRLKKSRLEGSNYLTFFYIHKSYFCV